MPHVSRLLRDVGISVFPRPLDIRFDSNNPTQHLVQETLGKIKSPLSRKDLEKWAPKFVRIRTSVQKYATRQAQKLR